MVIGSMIMAVIQRAVKVLMRSSSGFIWCQEKVMGFGLVVMSSEVCVFDFG